MVQGRVLQCGYAESKRNVLNVKIENIIFPSGKAPSSLVCGSFFA